MVRPVIMWFRQDLRLHDNAALAGAVASGKPIIAVYVLDDAGAGHWAVGGASRWWLHKSLDALSRSLEKLGGRLILRRGRAVEALMALAAETKASAIHVSRAYEPFNAQLETSLKTEADARGIEVHRFAGTLLIEPETIATKDGKPFRVFSPFWKELQRVYDARPPSSVPGRLVPPKSWPPSDTLADWRLLPSKPDWAGGLAASWQPGEAGAAKCIEDFVSSALAGYAGNRDRPDMPGTSRLSPHLHFGEVSPRQCWHVIDGARQRAPKLDTGATSFLRELAWREFSYHLLHHWPTLPETPFKAAYADFPWEQDAAARKAGFAAWSRGRTGYPIVDAGMRQLWQAGWMHNRVRMIVASFLIKHLMIPWQDGANWFWDTLVDADLANNAASWQWVAGSGADAAPYFRIFNPILQGQKFDPDGAYVRQFVPELAKLPDKYLHAPWTAPGEVLARAGVRLGGTYPQPIVEHDTARRRALDAFAALKSDTSTE